MKFLHQYILTWWLILTIPDRTGLRLFSILALVVGMFWGSVLTLFITDNFPWFW